MWRSDVHPGKIAPYALDMAAEMDVEYVCSRAAPKN